VLAAVPLIFGAMFMAGSLGVTAHVHDIDAFNLYLAMLFDDVRDRAFFRSTFCRLVAGAGAHPAANGID
jgi:hypothetical protein